MDLDAFRIGLAYILDYPEYKSTYKMSIPAIENGLYINQSYKKCKQIRRSSKVIGGVKGGALFL